MNTDQTFHELAKKTVELWESLGGAHTTWGVATVRYTPWASEDMKTVLGLWEEAKQAVEQMDIDPDKDEVLLAKIEKLSRLRDKTDTKLDDRGLDLMLLSPEECYDCEEFASGLAETLAELIRDEKLREETLDLMPYADEDGNTVWLEDDDMDDDDEEQDVASSAETVSKEVGGLEMKATPLPGGGIRLTLGRKQHDARHRGGYLLSLAVQKTGGIVWRDLKRVAEGTVDSRKDTKNVNNALKGAPMPIRERFKVTRTGIEITGEVLWEEE
jgi:hypothetical protein